MTRTDAEILSIEDLAHLFACDKETAASRLISGDLPGLKVGRGWIIPRQALFERINEKAREESAARREEWSQIHQAPILKQNSSKTAIAVTPSSNITRKGKRRIPPLLPKI